MTVTSRSGSPTGQKAPINSGLYFLGCQPRNPGDSTPRIDAIRSGAGSDTHGGLEG